MTRVDNGAVKPDFKGLPPRSPGEMPPPTQLDLADMVVADLARDDDYTLANIIQQARLYGVTDPEAFERIEWLINAPSVLESLPKLLPYQRSLADWQRLPEITYFDDAKLLPNVPGGSIAVLYGEYGSHKTNVTLSLLFNAMTRDEDLRVLYLAGEGATGIGKYRFPAQAEATEWGKRWKAKGWRASEPFDYRIVLDPDVPLIMDPASTIACIDRHRGLQPHIVVIDTLATALAGEDENSAGVSSQLTGNGNVAAMVKEFGGCLVLLVAHQGKDASRGVRGHSGIMGNVDCVLHVETDKNAAGTWPIRVKVEKMRDGEDGQCVYFKAERDGKVPVPVKITEAEYLTLAKSAAKETDKTLPVGMMVKSFLRLNGHHDWGTGLEVPELAAALTEQEFGNRPDDVTEAAAWDTAKLNWRKALNGAKRSGWGKPCFEERIAAGGSKPILRWFCAPSDADAEDEEL